MDSVLKLFGRVETVDWTGFLDREARIEGQLEAPGTFRLDGKLRGRIRSGHLLVLGESAEVEGEIEGERVAIYGRFRGTVRAKVQVEIHARAMVAGDVHTAGLIVEPGGRFDGHCYLLQEGEPVRVAIRGAAAEKTEG